LTLFDDGTLITLGNEVSYIAVQPDYSHTRRLYRTVVDTYVMNSFIEFLDADGFLEMPKFKGGEKYGFICDHYTGNGNDHEVCRPSNADHPFLDAIEKEIEDLVTSANDVWESIVPESIYVRKVIVDTITCAVDDINYIFLDDSTFGKEWDVDRFYHEENVLAFWDAYSRRVCYTPYSGELGDDRIAFEVTTSDISVYFNYDNYDPGYDATETGRNYQELFPYETLIIITAVVFLLMIIGSIALRKKKSKNYNHQVQTVDHNNFQMTVDPNQQPQYMYTEQPAFYVQQTENGPVYYATNNNVMATNPAVYTVVNQ